MAVAVSGAFRLSFGLKPTGSEVGYELRIANSRASREPVRIVADGLARRSTPGFLLLRPLFKKRRVDIPPGVEWFGRAEREDL